MGVLGALGDAWDGAKKGVGSAVDATTNVVGDGLESVGAEGAADAVEDWGDGVASDLGAGVGEQQLGETDQANELVHGRTSALAGSVKHLKDFQKAFERVGQGMAKLDAGHWQGRAADAFREKFGMHPKKWLHAADACEDAAKALDAYADTVRWAQDQAAEAIRLYASGTKASNEARDAYNAKVGSYKAAFEAGDDPGAHPGDFVDSGKADREEAVRILSEARRQRNEAGADAGAKVRGALRHAPAAPSGLDRVKTELADFKGAVDVESLHLAGGVLKGGAGLLSSVRAVNPLDTYNLTHPAEYMQGMNLMAAGLVTTARNAEKLPGAMVDAFKKDPMEFIGRLIPELIGSKGAGAVRGGLRKGLKNGQDLAESGTGREARDAVDQNPKAEAQEKDTKTCEGDPVDVATGRMLLEQTDVALPGVLPLVFSRTFESSFRSGGWFGPTWASTVDQRLLIDASGVIFVREDRSLLAYPHPAPGVPVLPVEGQRWPLDRDPAGGYTVTDSESGRVWHFTDHNDELALLDQIDDRNGNWITCDYDEDGTPTALTHSAGHQLRFTTEDGRITALHLGDQELVRYGYTDGHLTSVTGTSGRPLRFGCDEQGRITSWTDTNDSRFDYVYDEQDRCVFQSGTEGHLRSAFTYDTTDPATGHRVTTITDSLGRTRRYLINDATQVVAEIDPLGAVTRFERDRYNRLLSRTDPLGHTTRLDYDDHGNPSVVTRPDGRETRAEYNDLGLPVRLVGYDGGVTEQTFDAHGNRTSVTGPDGRTTHFTYTARGHLATVTDPLGNSTRVDCNEAGLPEAVTDPLGGVTWYRRDGFGRVTSVTDPLGGTAHLVWTPEGKLAARIAPDGSEESWIYDGEGNCTSHTDAVGGITTYEYTHFDLLAAQTGPDGVRYEFTHDTELRLARVTNPQGLTWDYDYDPAGRLMSETDFDNRTLSYTRDPAGQLTTRTNALGQAVTYTHDVLGRIVEKSADGEVTAYRHDAAGRLLQATGTDATLTYTRDRTGRITAETVNGRTTAHAYDAAGRRTQRTTPSGATSTFTYDAAGRRTTLTASGRTLAFEHDAAGREISAHYGGMLTLANTFDATGRLTAQTLTGTEAETIQRRRYTYRPDGNLIGIEDHLNGPRTFDLDRAGRVTSVRARDWTETYAYDEAGNQTQADWPARHPSSEARGTRTYTGTRITQAGRIRYEHDAQGRITLRQKTRLSRKPDTWRYTWDAEDRLTQVTTPDGQTWRYAYDPLGRRIAKRRIGADESILEQIDFTWDGTTLTEQTTKSPSADNPVTITWDHNGLRPIAQTERKTLADAPQQEIDQRFFAIVTDLVGTPTELVDETGAIAWRTRATLWGTTTWTQSSTAYTPLRFPGQYFDPETQLHYNYFRHYDPETARYTSPDPLGLTPSPNPSTYVHNPHTWTDPLGLTPCDGGCSNGGSWDPAEEPYLHRGVGYADDRSPAEWQRMYENAQHGVAEPLGGHSDPQLHVGGRTDSDFTSWTTDYEGMALEESFRGNGPGIVMRIPNGDGPGYARVPGLSFPYAEGEVTIRGVVRGAEISINGGPWIRPR
ncbi:putative T7SS-secreted protein [Streptomyces sp. NPDC004647]|uniref:putative T7SS-secreted protein n=1 Tax=Streptomyces sp. NPDC004647 TaxID=3154671 RepID=UPI0033A345E1